MPTFGGIIENPEHGSFGAVCQLLDSIVNLFIKLEEVFSFKLKNPGAVPKYLIVTSC